MCYLTDDEFKELEARVLDMVKPEDDGTAFVQLVAEISTMAARVSVATIQEYQKMLEKKAAEV